MKKYYPILVSKNGETGALMHLEQSVKDGICPVIEVINTTLVKINKHQQMSYSDKFEKFLKTHWSFDNNEIILDFSLFKDWRQHESYIKNTLVRLINSGVNIVLSVQTNSHPSYKRIVDELTLNYGCNLCFRFSNSSGGFIHMNNDIPTLLQDYLVNIKDVILLVDLGQIDFSNYNTIGSSVGVVIQNLNPNTFKSMVLAASSFPGSLNDFSVSPNAHTRVRYEWNLYNSVARGDLKHLKYGDYGTKAALYADVQFMGSISLKYSTEKEFVIYRGQRTVDNPLGHKQFINHSRNLVTSPYYTNNNFCWGDLRYNETSNESLVDGKSGNSTQWVQFSQNHHITLMHSIL